MVTSIYPPCDFGPVDLDETFYYLAEFDPYDGPAEVTGAEQFEVLDTGYTELLIQVEPSRFGGKHISARRPVEILPIEVIVSPERANGEPGYTVKFVVTVENAHDTSIAFAIEPEGGHVIADAKRLSAKTFELTVVTSANSEDFPAQLIVESIADQGLRAKPSAPPRIGNAILSSGGEISISPGAACVDWGDTLQFLAEVFGYTDTGVTWSATGGSISNSGRFTAPQEDMEVTVTATSAANSRVSDSAIVTVTKSCQCWASISLPHSGVTAISTTGHLAFDRSSPTDPDAGPGRLSSLRLVPKGASLITLGFNDQPARAPERPHYQAGERIDDTIIYDVQNHPDGSVSFFAMPTNANPRSSVPRSTVRPSQAVRLDQGPLPGETGKFLISLNHLDPEARLGAWIGTMTAGKDERGYPAGSANLYTLGHLDQRAEQPIAIVRRPLWESAISGDVYDTHLLEFDTDDLPIPPVPLFPELTLHIEEYQPGPEPDQFWLKGVATGDVLTRDIAGWNGVVWAEDTRLRLQPIRIQFQGLYRHPREFTVPPPDPDGRVCRIDGAF